MEKNQHSHNIQRRKVNWPIKLQTSVVGKLCEIVIKEKWVKYLEEQVTLNRKFVFRTGRSCVLNLLSFYSRVVEGLESRDGWVNTVYLDIKKGILEIRDHRRTERNFVRLDKVLFKGQRDENCDQTYILILGVK
ncbi:hypothetical protein E2C01_034000 [Portunus trituberculatus]|uniref:Reverse transcriptase domain-containing protein n=1 Tax=Portunus trituberculatus TaxID=210409 RepID=A0A5B7F5R3_PORTR|nr:hypothetical protein [Portunus trituberculatus]